MTPTTKEQRKALKQVFDRCPNYPGGKSSAMLAVEAGWTYSQHEVLGWIWSRPNMVRVYHESNELVKDLGLAKPLTYLQFRRLVSYGWDCLMVPWAGMWLGIEKDGYTHS